MTLEKLLIFWELSFSIVMCEYVSNYLQVIMIAELLFVKYLVTHWATVLSGFNSPDLVFPLGSSLSSILCMLSGCLALLQASTNPGIEPITFMSPA